ncbi:MAG: hypothetical protein AWM53_00061 [Candidatus Dichloromethanomonas elyunquensis]|nr:MAG: hypothetical protein AWM53_00061 [Candidatus Dichloromethanomonas elyunquensis]
MKIPILALIFQGIPEQMAVAALAFVIANIPLVWKRIALIGTIVACSAYVLRLLPITFGIHTVLIMSLLFILLIVIGKGNINSSLIASLISFLSLIIAETISLSLLMPLLNVDLQSLTTDSTARIIIGLPQEVIIILLAFVIFKIKNRK